MKSIQVLKTLVPMTLVTERIARFGDGCLVRLADGRFFLQGGGEADLAAAREWAAHFLHEVPYIGRMHGRG